MSAATRGFELPLTIVPVPSNEIKGIIVGTRLSLLARTCGSSQEQFSEWYVKSIQGNLITVAPVRGLEIGCRGIESLRLTCEQLLSKFRIVTTRKVC